MAEPLSVIAAMCVALSGTLNTSMAPGLSRMLVDVEAVTLDVPNSTHTGKSAGLVSRRTRVGFPGIATLADDVLTERVVEFAACGLNGYAGTHWAFSGCAAAAAFCCMCWTLMAWFSRFAAMSRACFSRCDSMSRSFIWRSSSKR